MKERIYKLKSDQMNRIIKEVLHNDYLKRFSTNIKTLFGALIGEEGLVNEINKYERMKKNFIDKVKQIRTYTIAEDIIIKEEYIREHQRIVTQISNRIYE